MSVIPEASPAPRWWQTLRYITQPLDYLEQAAQRSGDMFNAPVIGSHKNVFFISHPDGIQQLFANNACITAPANGLLQPIVGEQSIFGLEGKKHRRERKLMMPAFHRERIADYGALITELTQQAIAILTPGQPFMARSLMQRISLEVILQVVFGLTAGERFETLKALIVELTDYLQNPWVSGSLFMPILQNARPWAQFQQVRQRVSTVLLAEISERRTQDLSDKIDVLSLLMTSEDEAGQGMTDAELHDELLTLLVAGHETTASAIAWALYWTHRDTRIYQTLREEIQALGTKPDPMAIARLPYLTAVCHETLRIYPIAFVTVPREAIAPTTIMGYDIEPGTRLYGAIYLTHHHPDLYPDSKTFQPERFLKRPFANHEFLPFGGGVRRCIGEVLALFELKLVLAMIVSQYSFAWVDDKPEVPKRRGVTLAPGNGVKMVLRSS
ncbi:MAG: cytochrome P450 [Spirulina sp. SIO3F2]|nr:cytochrome P450 [Spirulina sp. SIO3F2]